jgi:D-methionine transport system permease protein
MRGRKMTPDNLDLALKLLPLQLWNTLYMVFVSAFFAVLIGLPLGVILAVADKGHIKENVGLYRILEAVVNIGRSFPFAILMVALIPVTRLIVGTSLGTTASIVPLSIAAAPFFARLVEFSLKEVDRNIIEAAIVIGSNAKQVVAKVLLPEALPSIVQSITMTIVNLIGYSAMAGLVGGGGLGQVAIQYGYNRFNTPIMVSTVVLLILLVQAVQWTGGSIVKSIYRKRGKITHD